jgi:hypothetical protein
MKNIILSIVLFIPLTALFSQDLTDVVRFSQQDLMGTARFTSMGGAFSSLGGDMSSLRLNPAGSSIFLNNHASGTLSLNLRNNDVAFGDGLTNNNESDFNLNQAGAVFVFTSNNPQETISKYAYGFTYDQVADYNDSYSAVGSNNQSIDQFFLNSAQGLPLDLLVPFSDESISELYRFLGETEGVSAQNALLGYQTFIFDAVNPDDFNNTEYISNIVANSFMQDYFISESGYNSEFSFNASLEIKKRFYFGLNLNAHYMQYNRFTSFIETNSGAESQINRVRFDNNLRTRSSGFSFQIGSIAKITNNLRASLSYNSPIWYNVTDETEQFIRTNSNEFGPSSIDPNVINIFPDYNIRTASKWTAGLSYIFDKKGLISVDYSLQDYSNSTFRSNTLQFLNSGIEQNLTTAANLNIGGEYVYKQFRLRGGYFSQESPYQDKSILGDINGYTMGLGYNFNNLNIDLAYSLASVDRDDILYQTDLMQTADVSSDISNIFITFSFGF